MPAHPSAFDARSCPLRAPYRAEYGGLDGPLDTVSLGWLIDHWGYGNTHHRRGIHVLFQSIMSSGSRRLRVMLQRPVSALLIPTDFLQKCRMATFTS
jgi:hypothetical protein